MAGKFQMCFHENNREKKSCTDGVGFGNPVLCPVLYGSGAGICKGEDDQPDKSGENVGAVGSRGYIRAVEGRSHTAGETVFAGA